MSMLSWGHQAKKPRIAALAICAAFAGLGNWSPSAARGAQRVYVDASAGAPHNGTTWATAYNNLQQALSMGGPGDIEIWVADGTYYPDGGFKPTGGARVAGSGSRTATFQLHAMGMAVYGHFNGTETQRSQRNLSNPATATMLSGDLAGNDGPNFANNSENSYHVVTGSYTNATTVLDGFTITGGFATGTDGLGGAGMYNAFAGLIVANCTFTGNFVFGQGGGMQNFGSGQPGEPSPTVTNCIFTGNTAGNGGGMCNLTSSPIVTDCTFARNSAGTGGGMSNTGGHLVVANCLFAGNTVGSPGQGSGIGGGILITGGVSTLTNCTFAGNSAGDGGGMKILYFAAEDGATLNNCTFTGNSAYLTGGAIRNDFDVASLGLTATNCILWGNTAQDGPEIYSFGTDAVHATYCDIQGGRAGVGNIDVDPLMTPDGLLRSGSPCINTGLATGAPANDIDGEARPAGGGVDIGSDEFIDSDGDGMPDHWETKYSGSPTAMSPAGDSDNDGLTNLQEYELYGSNPMSLPTYVWNNGSPSPDGTLAHPYNTIQAGIDAASDHGTVLVHAGSSYSGAGNRGLNFASKSVIVRTWNGAGPSQSANVTIDCGNTSRAVSSAAGYSAMQGFGIINGQTSFGANYPDGLGGGAILAQSRLVLDDCTIANSHATYGGAIYMDRSSAAFDSLTLGAGNTAVTADAGVVAYSNVKLLGTLHITTCSLHVFSSSIDGPGSINLARPVTLHVSGGEDVGPATVPLATYLHADITGTGSIIISPFGQLILEHGATIDLSGQMQVACADPAQSVSWGTITVDGLLLVHDANIRNTNVEVRLANLTGSTSIINNDIRLPETVAGYGGQFFVAGGSTVECNVINSDGDRFLDFDPDPAALPRPTIGSGPTANKISVNIKQGVGTDQGELLDLRSHDNDSALFGGVSGAHELAGSAGDSQNGGYHDTWVLEKLTIQAGAKVNLTNRAGFDFDSASATPEALYVKQIVMYPNATLNTGLQRLYYRSLVDENGAALNPASLTGGRQIVDSPLLGFSLKVIALEDDTEFDVRVQRRLRDPADAQVCQCDGVCPDNSPPLDASTCKQGSVVRATGLDPGNPANGVMDMRTHAAGGQTASSVAAKGAFARAGDEDILIAFEYLFAADPNNDAEIVVYLSDTPDPNPVPNVGDAHNVLVARIRPPLVGRAGSIGSGAFATFYGLFPRGNLNFTRGTYVELELRGVDSRVWIDTFDPQVRCTTACADLSGDQAVSTADYLYVLGEYGQTLSLAGFSKWCLDSVLNGDRYVDFGDLLAWDLYLNNPDALNLCGSGAPDEPTRGGGSPVSFPATTLVVAGKPTGGGLQEDYLYPLTTAGACGGAAQRPASVSGPNGYRGNTKLIRDGGGALYQLHTTQGLVRLNDAQTIVEPAVVTFGGNQVYVGVNPVGGGDFAGVPMTDAAFDPDDSTTVYVVPVYVAEPGFAAYKAAAKLSLSGTGSFTVQRIYGLNPALDPCASSTSPPGLECSAQNLREIEFVAGTGGGADALLVTASRADNGNDWLLIYNEQTAGETRIALGTLSTTLTAPIGLTYVAGLDKTYLASAVNDPGASTADVYRLNLTRTSGVVTGAALDAVVHVSNLRSVTDIAANPADGSVWVLGFTAPVFGQYQTFANGDSIQATPRLASIAASTGSGATVAANLLTCQGLALPVSLGLSSGATVTTGACCVDPPGANNSTCSDVADASACHPFICDVHTQLPGTFLGCYGDADGNGVVNAGDRGFISANIGQTSSVLVCKFDMDGNGTINAGDRGFVSANIGLCVALPDWMNGSGSNHGVPDTRFGTAGFQGAGSTCAATTCP